MGKGEVFVVGRSMGEDGTTESISLRIGCGNGEAWHCQDEASR